MNKLKILILGLILSTLVICGCVEESKSIHIWAGKGFKEPLIAISKDFSEKENVKIDFSFVGFYEMVKHVNKTNADIVIAPKKYELFNVRTIELLEKKGLVKDSKPFIKRIPVIVVRKGSDINSLSDLNGKKIALINQTKYHIPGGCLGNEIVRKEKINGTFIFISPKNLINAVKEEKADATIVWLDTIKKDDTIKVIPIDGYELQLYIAIINDNEVVRKYVDYLLSHKEEFEKYGWR
ncbi:substrate-binding domain-containing protein [Methanotorris formicicus]|uniref:Extracellular solute-binding protein family 3 n=1 Tax=Methanotorris formicicus Mc-S-70 TaxID=647171 RepID=H1KWW4_9EURY|nr:substrate-binding domain-containing protein [Methanotorris formicicus]EHP89097.1 extracellular solute-binding protein family 3 [Methanotorris formicicus Mc-S-70]